MSNDHFFDEQNNDDSGREMAKEVIRRVFLWVADGSTLEDRGFRATVAVFWCNPEIFGGASLEDIGMQTGRKRQAVWKMKQQFKQALGL